MEVKISHIENIQIIISGLDFPRSMTALVINLNHDSKKYSQIPLFTAFDGYEAILFDLDGVFVNSNNAWIIALQKVLENENLKAIPTDDIEKQLALSTKRQIEFFFPEFKNSPEKIDDLVIKVDGYYRDHIAEFVKLNLGTHEFLSRLQKQFKLALVTNNGEAVTLSIVNHFDLEKYFDEIIHLEIMKLPKPSPEGIKMALSRLGINHEPATPSVVFIGDSPSDLETSLRANIQFILIKEDTSSFEFPQIPSNVRVVSGVSDLIVYCN